MIVADTNLIAYLLIDGEHTGSARRVWRRDPSWTAPPLWRSEFLDVLVTAVAAKVLGEDDAALAWHRGTSLMRGREREPSGSDVLHRAVALGLSAYDAHFVVLAEALDVPLVTGDRRILRACPERAVSPRKFA